MEQPLHEKLRQKLSLLPIPSTLLQGTTGLRDYFKTCEELTTISHADLIDISGLDNNATVTCYGCKRGVSIPALATKACFRCRFQVLSRVCLLKPVLKNLISKEETEDNYDCLWKALTSLWGRENARLNVADYFKHVITNAIVKDYRGCDICFCALDYDYERVPSTRKLDVPAEVRIWLANPGLLLFCQACRTDAKEIFPNRRWRTLNQNSPRVGVSLAYLANRCVLDAKTGSSSSSKAAKSKGKRSPASTVVDDQSETSENLTSRTRQNFNLAPPTTYESFIEWSLDHYPNAPSNAEAKRRERIRERRRERDRERKRKPKKKGFRGTQNELICVSHHHKRRKKKQRQQKKAAIIREEKNCWLGDDTSGNDSNSNSELDTGIVNNDLLSKWRVGFKDIAQGVGFREIAQVFPGELPGELPGEEDSQDSIGCSSSAATDDCEEEEEEEEEKEEKQEEEQEEDDNDDNMSNYARNQPKFRSNRDSIAMPNVVPPPPAPTIPPLPFVAVANTAVANTAPSGGGSKKNVGFHQSGSHQSGSPLEDRQRSERSGHRQSISRSSKEPPPPQQQPPQPPQPQQRDYDQDGRKREHRSRNRQGQEEEEEQGRASRKRRNDGERESAAAEKKQYQGQRQEPPPLRQEPPNLVSPPQVTTVPAQAVTTVPALSPAPTPAPTIAAATGVQQSQQPQQKPKPKSAQPPMRVAQKPPMLHKQPPMVAATKPAAALASLLDRAKSSTSRSRSRSRSGSQTNSDATSTTEDDQEDEGGGDQASDQANKAKETTKEATQTTQETQEEAEEAEVEAAAVAISQLLEETEEATQEYGYRDAEEQVYEGAYEEQPLQDEANEQQPLAPAAPAEKNDLIAAWSGVVKMVQSTGELPEWAMAVMANAPPVLAAASPSLAPPSLLEPPPLLAPQTPQLPIETNIQSIIDTGTQLRGNLIAQWKHVKQSQTSANQWMKLFSDFKQITGDTIKSLEQYTHSCDIRLKGCLPKTRLSDTVQDACTAKKNQRKITRELVKVIKNASSPYMLVPVPGLRTKPIAGDHQLIKAMGGHTQIHKPFYGNIPDEVYTGWERDGGMAVYVEQQDGEMMGFQVRELDKKLEAEVIHILTSARRLFLKEEEQRLQEQRLQQKSTQSQSQSQSLIQEPEQQQQQLPMFMTYYVLKALIDMRREWTIRQQGIMHSPARCVRVLLKRDWGTLKNKWDEEVIDRVADHCGELTQDKNGCYVQAWILTFANVGYMMGEPEAVFVADKVCNPRPEIKDGTVVEVMTLGQKAKEETCLDYIVERLKDCVTYRV